jgi:geranylgeranyl diphosphate synthase type I
MTGSTSQAPATQVVGMELLRPAMQSAFTRLHPQLTRVCNYHRGWCDADGTPVDGAEGGKSLRPALVFLGAAAAGGPPDEALPGALAVEMIHDFSLLHDDVIDNDRTRRHRPTAWTVFGVPPALLAGDALVGLATELLVEIPGDRGRRAALVLAATMRRLMAGQTDDLAFETRDDVTFGNYLTMAGAKTAALLSCSVAVGALLGGGDEELVAGMTALGEHLGLAFQLVDDLLALWGDPAVTGKPVLSDLRARKKSAPIVCALDSDHAGIPALRKYLNGRQDADEATLQHFADVIEQSGARAQVEAEAERHLHLTQATIDELPVSAPVASQLTALAEFVTRRSR